MRWDIFCKVIDNHGDLGVCWRLAADLAMRGDTVRLWADDASMLEWMAPQGRRGVEVLRWNDGAGAEPGDAIVEAFGCELDPAFIEAIAARTRATGRQPAWINLEYLSAEAWVERCHGLPSPVSAGPGAGLTKHFFYPGFTRATGGLIREADLPERRAAFDRERWLQDRGIDWHGRRLVSLFCYEPPGLAAFLAQLRRDPRPTTLLVTAGRAEAAVRAHLPVDATAGPLSVHYLPLMEQREFDHLLWACDLNLVRGEDSIVRALWAGRPAVWNIYPQDDDAHLPKLDAFLDWLDAPSDLRAFHRAWNQGGQPTLPADLRSWQSCADAARDRLLALPDLTAQLQSFARRVAGPP